LTRGFSDLVRPLQRHPSGHKSHQRRLFFRFFVKRKNAIPCRQSKSPFTNIEEVFPIFCSALKCPFTLATIIFLCCGLIAFCLMKWRVFTLYFASKFCRDRCPCQSQPFNRSRPLIVLPGGFTSRSRPERGWVFLARYLKKYARGFGPAAYKKTPPDLSALN